MDQHEIDRGIAVFKDADADAQQAMLEGSLAVADKDAVKKALDSDKVKENVGTYQPLPGVDDDARARLYLTILLILGFLALVALVGGGWALVAGKESAAFFTFAGLALGGITGILVPSPAAA